MEIDDQTNKSEAKSSRRWCHPYLLVLLVGLLIFIVVNECYLYYYYDHDSRRNTGIVSGDNFSMVVVEMAYLIISLLLFSLLRWLVKRRFQYSLRSLMIFTTLFAIACSWFAVNYREAKSQRDAVEALRKDGKFSVMRYMTSNIISSWLAKWLGEDFFCGIRQIDANVALTDADLADLNGITHLGILALKNTKITDDGLCTLISLPHFDLSHLTWLDLSNTNITDDGLKHLGNMPNLAVLELKNTRITDAGLAHLKGLGKLRFVYLMGTSVTVDGAYDLQKAIDDLQGESRELLIWQNDKAISSRR
jgi:hypothetical protein